MALLREGHTSNQQWPKPLESINLSLLQNGLFALKVQRLLLLQSCSFRCMILWECAEPNLIQSNAKRIIHRFFTFFCECLHSFLTKAAAFCLGQMYLSNWLIPLQQQNCKIEIRTNWQFILNCGTPGSHRGVEATIEVTKTWTWY